MNEQVDVNSLHTYIHTYLPILVLIDKRDEKSSTLREDSVIPSARPPPWCIYHTECMYVCMYVCIFSMYAVMESINKSLTFCMS